MNLIKYLVGVLFFLGSGYLFYDSVLDKQNETILYPYKMRIYLPSAIGIKEGTDVSLQGINFGIVREIKEVNISQVEEPRFISENDKAIELKLAVKHPITLWDNYRIKFKSKTAFSGRTIDIDPGYFDKDSEASFSPTSGSEILDEKSPSADFYDEFFTGANNLLVENKQDLRNTTANLRNISEKIRNGKGTVSRFINEDTVYNNLSETVSDVRITALEARRYLEMTRENDTIPTTFTMVVIFNYLNLNILSR